MRTYLKGHGHGHDTEPSETTDPCLMPLTETQATALGTALAVASHGPEARALFETIQFPHGDRIESWSVGGCHLFALAVTAWINEGRKSSRSPRAEPWVLGTDLHLCHVTTLYRGWLFDDRGAWTQARMLRHYRGLGHYWLQPYDPTRYTADLATMPTDVKAVRALTDVLRGALGRVSEWTASRSVGPTWAGHRLLPEDPQTEAVRTLRRGLARRPSEPRGGIRIPAAMIPRKKKR